VVETGKDVAEKGAAVASHVADGATDAANAVLETGKDVAGTVAEKASAVADAVTEKVDELKS
jgi:hypothetical protein